MVQENYDQRAQALTKDYKTRYQVECNRQVWHLLLKESFYRLGGYFTNTGYEIFITYRSLFLVITYYVYVAAIRCHPWLPEINCFLLTNGLGL